MTDEQRTKCGGIIHSASLAAAGAGVGLAQLPLVDTAVLLPIHIGMIVGLGRVFGVQITDEAAKGIALGATGALAGRALSRVLLGWVPLVGNALNALTAASITEAVGWIAAKRFAAGQFSETTAGSMKVAADDVSKQRRIAVRVAIDADTPAHEADVIRAVRNVVETVGFVSDDDAA